MNNRNRNFDHHRSRGYDYDEYRPRYTNAYVVDDYDDLHRRRGEVERRDGREGSSYYPRETANRRGRGLPSLHTSSYSTHSSPSTSRLFQTRPLTIPQQPTTTRTPSPSPSSPPPRSSPPPKRSPPPPLPTSPTPSYIADSQIPSSTLPNPTHLRKLLILDLNGTLLLRAPYSPPRKSISKSKHSPIFNPYAPRPLRTVLPRPFLSSFRQYIFHPKTQEWLDTMVWSSAQPHSVNDMVQKAFCDDIPGHYRSVDIEQGNRKGKEKPTTKSDLLDTRKLVAVWARDTLDLDRDAYFQKTQTTKNLIKPWSYLNSPFSPPNMNKPPLDINTKKQLHSSRTTILLDDSPLKARLQPYNHVCVREYTMEMRVGDLKAAKAARAGGDERDKGAVGSGEITRVVEPIEAIHYSNYDLTLLSFIGVLDRIKWESNVAGWIRSGGLFGVLDQSDGAGLNLGTGEGLESGRDEDGVGCKETETETGNEGDSDSPPMRKKHDLSADGEEKELSSLEKENIIGMDTNSKMWFEDGENMVYWANRGVCALKELGIEVVPGVFGFE